jgi:amidohydrolase
MPIINRIAEFHDDMKAWRRHLHANPELDLDCFETAAFVADRLREFGVDEIHDGIARTGLVAIINGKSQGPTIGLRADMDALPMAEARDLPHKSKNPGVMHACGHDGHTTMLLGAARYLAETRNFKGRVALIFQPAEEASGGGRIMCEEGMMQRFDIAQVYGIHNVPNLPAGSFHTRTGPLLAAVDSFRITLTGVGGHGAYPHECVDPVFAAVQLAQGLQAIIARNVAANDRAVVSVTEIHAGSANNIIPGEVWLGGTVRTYAPQTRQMIENRVRAIADGIAAAFGVSAAIDYDKGYPPTVNHPDQTRLAASIARAIAGDDAVEDDQDPEMGGEDFSYMLLERPGAFVFLGQGDGAALHHPDYDFNDEVSPVGASFFARLVETAQPA